MIKKILVLAAFILSLPAQSDVLYKNTTIFNGFGGAYYADNYTMIDGFSLTSDVHLSGISWVGFEKASAEYIDTTYTIFSGSPYRADIIFSETLVASRSENSLGRPGWQGYDFSLSGLSIDLSAGTYYLGIHQNAGDVFSSIWAIGEGSPLPGDSYQATGSLNRPFSNDVNFVLTGSEIPVPAAAWLFGSALISLAGLRRKK